ncbi:TylF/MycF/NovP-related O-methyltransferase [Candidatus Nitrosarchaeum limnium]|jgi:O-methyltransferase|uniref:O-methyltransferase n=1 Tax=Candidatus Nitrosarchaeum limnium BG20 TaxID=859192 RepID=S2E1P4_9ARCH|nr:TylF/MycF/NovP-related O-methyltransferase [Candidatus Nitrosarchaeum limnium]EPA05240.1 hypothetical protein BG20_I0197 [Candidatus Nitrosarchaeum limnium BG20]
MISSHNLVYKSKLLGKILGYFVSMFQFRLLSFYGENDVASLIKSIKNDIDFAFFPYEAFVIHSIATSQSKISGDMAEVGVYQGGSAKIICEVKGNNKLHLFDTFEGLPKISDKDTHFGIKYWTDKQFSNTDIESVRKYLKDYEDVSFYKGKFPDTSVPVTDSKFSFVHLDVDLYESTTECLKFFYPRLVKGGIILTHDYHTNGVHSAFTEFFQGKNIPIIPINGSQCMIVKTE